MHYLPFGEEWYAEGAMPTDYLFTGQRLEAGLGGLAGLYDCGARYYDPTLGRFVQADTIVPNPANPQDLNRYSYTRNSPVRYNDPSGHSLPGGTTVDDPYVQSATSVRQPLVSWEFLSQRDPEDIVDYWVYYVETETGLTVPDGVTVEYGGPAMYIWGDAAGVHTDWRPYNGRNMLVDDPRTGRRDSSIYIEFMPGDFRVTSEDMVGVTYEEIHHARTEAGVEADSGYGNAVWNMPAVGGVSCPAHDGYTEGQRYVPREELDAKNRAFNLDLGYSQHFVDVYQDQTQMYQGMLNDCPYFYYP